MPSQQRSIVRRAWVATGLVLLCLVPVDPPRAEAQATTGSWQLGPNLPFFPIHDHVLPDGKVMMWPGDQGINGDDPRTWDPATGTVTTLPKAGFDIFCSGHSFLPDGRLFVAGGHISNGVGLANTSIYSPAANSWQSQPLMNQGRWYPTTTVLSNGDVLVVSGSVDGTIGSNPVPQVWQASSGTWRNLNSANLQQPLYPYMFLAPDGRVFDAGPGVTTRLLDTAGAGTWSVVGNHRLNASREYGSAVMYEPGKILLAGGGDPPTATAEVIDLNVPGPTWQTTSSMNRARRQMNLTMLPDGKVLGTGGTWGRASTTPVRRPSWPRCGIRPPAAGPTSSRPACRASTTPSPCSCPMAGSSLPAGTGTRRARSTRRPTCSPKHGPRSAPCRRPSVAGSPSSSPRRMPRRSTPWRGCGCPRSPTRTA